MTTRDQEAAWWQAISLNSRKAAQRLLEVECYRSSISRAYYAAYAAVTGELIRQGITLAHHGNNPSHGGLPSHILNNLNTLPMTTRFYVNKAIRRLYVVRVAADYVAAANADRAAATNAIRDLGRILQALGTDKRGG